jgi:LacI family transcriptional regulator
VSLSGFDDFELSGLVPRPIRIVDYDVADLGARAAVTLLDRIGGTDVADPRTHLQPTRLVDRGLRR